MSFHWQTEEDDSLWSEQTPASPPEQPGRFRNLPLLVILFGVLVLGGWAIYEQVTGRIAARSAQIEVDIQSSATVLHEAARQGDTELFTTLLSGRDAAWTEAQQELVAKGLFHDRTPLGLTASDDFRLQLTEIDVAADFLSVVVTFTLPMMSSPPGQPAQTVLLERAEVYRLGSDRWLLAPPEDSFWGEQRSVTGQRLSVTFPERDTIIGERLAADLDDHVAQFCERVAQETQR